jgi:hypothetical protein
MEMDITSFIMLNFGVTVIGIIMLLLVRLTETDSKMPVLVAVLIPIGFMSILTITVVLLSIMSGYAIAI